MMMTRMFMISDINDDSKDANKNTMIFMIKRVEDVLDQKSGSCCLIVLMQKRTRRMFMIRMLNMVLLLLNSLFNKVGTENGDQDEERTNYTDKITFV
jgi:hypothetical protein